MLILFSPGSNVVRLLLFKYSICNPLSVDRSILVRLLSCSRIYINVSVVGNIRSVMPLFNAVSVLRFVLFERSRVNILLFGIVNPFKFGLLLRSRLDILLFCICRSVKFVCKLTSIDDRLFHESHRDCNDKLFEISILDNQCPAKYSCCRFVLLDRSGATLSVLPLE